MSNLFFPRAGFTDEIIYSRALTKPKAIYYYSNMGKILLVLIVLGTFANQAFADDKLKSWYFNIGLGYAGTNYGSNGTMQSFANQQKALGYSDTPLCVDIGVYWPAGNKFLIGIADTGFGDSFSSPSTSASTAGSSIVSSNLLASLQFFPFSTNFSGLFVRADGGYGVVGTTTGFSLFPSQSSSGYALHGGLGISIPLGGTRLPLMAGYYYEGVSSGAISAVQVEVSVMW